MRRGGPRNDNWATPARVFDPLHQVLRFDLDAAASRHNAKCRRYFDLARNGLEQRWDGRSVWCNPPYGSEPGTDAWVEHGRTQAELLGNRVTMCVPIKAETAWYQDLVWGSNRVLASARLTGPLAGRWYRLREPRFDVELLELRGRLAFDDGLGDGRGSGWFASAIVVWGIGGATLHTYAHGLSTGLKKRDQSVTISARGSGSPSLHRPHLDVNGPTPHRETGTVRRGLRRQRD